MTPFLFVVNKTKKESIIMDKHKPPKGVVENAKRILEIRDEHGDEAYRWVSKLMRMFEKRRGLRKYYI